MATNTAVTAANGDETSLRNRINTAVDAMLYDTVMASLKVDPTEIPPYSPLGDTETINAMTLNDQLLRRHNLMETLKNEHCSMNCPPSISTAATVTEGLYGMRYDRPSLTGTGINLLSLQALHVRRTGDRTPCMALNSLFKALDGPHPSYSRTEVNCYRQITVRDLTGQDDTVNGGLNWSGIQGQPVRTDQTDWCLTVALPMSQLHGLLQGTVNPQIFTHEQQNFWFTARSSLLRALHMALQECPLNTEEHLGLMLFNPLRETTLGDFNRLYIDHCKTTAAGEMYHFSEVELRTGIILELQGLTLADLMPLRGELNMKTWYGLHCRGLLGHLVITDAMATMLQMSRTEATAAYQLGTEDDHEDGLMEVTEDAADHTVDVLLGSLPLNHRVTVTVKKSRH